jgi:hypothetical protein
MKAKRLPRAARTLRTYQEFRSYLRQFVEGIYPFLWIVGRPGVTKTEAIKTACLGGDVYYRKGGQLTPLQFFIDLYTHLGKPIILDDAEHFLKETKGRKLIAALGDTSTAKLLCYGSTNQQLQRAGVPQTFLTSSSLCIIANEVTADEAIQSRAVIISFQPTNFEIHRGTARWFWDQEIHDWFGQHLYRLLPIDARWYVHAEKDKRAGRNWREIVLKSHALTPACCVVQDLEQDPAFSTREAKAMRFVDCMKGSAGASRATYFRLYKKLKAANALTVAPVAPMRLRRQRPPDAPSAVELQELESGQPPRDQEPPAEPIDLPSAEIRQRPPANNPPATPRQALDDSLPWETEDDDPETDET